MLLRKKKKLSQSALGKMIGTSGDIIGRYERGIMTPSVDVVMKIADVLEVSIDFLVGKTSLELDKQTLKRIEAIAELSKEDKTFVLRMIDMALQNFKAHDALSAL